MPLQRDQRNDSEAHLPGPPATSQHPSTHLRGDAYDLQTKTLTIREMEKFARRSTGNPAGGKHFLESASSNPVKSVANLFKMNVPDTVGMHEANNTKSAAPARVTEQIKRKADSQDPMRNEKSKVSEIRKISTFDDTASLDQSMFESGSEEHEQTVVQRPQRTRRRSKQENVQPDLHRDNQGRARQGLPGHELYELYPGWKDDVEEERRNLADGQTHTPQPQRPCGRGLHPEEKSQYSQPPMYDQRQEPGTPSRTQSAPPEKIAASGKNVNFATSDQFLSQSPSFVSSEIAREDSIEYPMARPSSVQPHTQNVPVHAEPQQWFDPQRVARQSQGNAIVQNGRFHHMTDHIHKSRQENPKVSAPESDNQEFSEDERAQISEQHDEQIERFGTMQPQRQQAAKPVRKRSHEEMTNGLDYSQADLKQKKLSDLQNELFTHDPRAAPQAPPTDTMGNEMTLIQILENLSKMSPDTQQETFRTLTDEQWADTGQWFVDRFQKDLAKLMEVRLERRKVTMKYEDTIRQRQRLVEHHAAGVDRELEELQAGGRQLVDGRKAPGGSRAGTPMKGVR